MSHRSGSRQHHRAVTRISAASQGTQCFSTLRPQTKAQVKPTLFPGEGDHRLPVLSVIMRSGGGECGGNRENGEQGTYLTTKLIFENSGCSDILPHLIYVYKMDLALNNLQWFGFIAYQPNITQGQLNL